MNNRINKAVKISALTIIMALSFAGYWMNGATAVEIDCYVARVDELGGAILDVSADEIADAGFDLGDSVDIFIGDDCVIRAVPYYNDFYGHYKDTILVQIQETVLIGDLYNDLAEEHNISGGEKVRILLDEHEKYADILDLYRLENSNDVDDFNTTQEFINAREVTGGDIGGGILYRSSGPFDDRYGRQDAVAEYIENNNINTVIALADTEKSISEYDGIADNVRQMINNDQVIYSDLGIKIHSDEFRDNVADCCREIPQKEGPYLVQRAWRRDRTGFVCILLEGLMGASYDEVLDDYMLSYKSLYQLTEESNPEKYSLFEEKGDEMVDCISGEETLSDADKKDLSRIAGKYLKDGGLSESKISDLKNVLSGD